MTAALVLLAALAGDPSRVATGIGLAVFGLGFGMVTQVLIVAVQNSVERRELGVATATTGFFRALGGAVGAAVLGAVFAAQAGAHGAAERSRATSSTACRRSSWSPRRSPRWRCRRAAAEAPARDRPCRRTPDRDPKAAGTDDACAHHSSTDRVLREASRPAARSP